MADPAAYQPELRYFEAMAVFESPDEAEEAAAALATAGYAFEQTPYVYAEFCLLHRYTA
jgi:hypothetical protein